MNSDELMAQAHAEAARRNAETAVHTAKRVEQTLTERVNRLENLVRSLHQQVAQQNEKYNLLLTQRFNGGATSE